MSNVVEIEKEQDAGAITDIIAEELGLIHFDLIAPICSPKELVWTISFCYRLAFKRTQTGYLPAVLGADLKTIFHENLKMGKEYLVQGELIPAARLLPHTELTSKADVSRATMEILGHIALNQILNHRNTGPRKPVEGGVYWIDEYTQISVLRLNYHGTSNPIYTLAYWRRESLDAPFTFSGIDGDWIDPNITTVKAYLAEIANALRRTKLTEATIEEGLKVTDSTITWPDVKWLGLDSPIVDAEMTKKIKEREGSALRVINKCQNQSMAIHLITGELMDATGLFVKNDRDFTVEAITGQDELYHNLGYSVKFTRGGLRHISLIRTGKRWLLRLPGRGADEVTSTLGLRKLLFKLSQENELNHEEGSDMKTQDKIETDWNMLSKLLFGKQTVEAFVEATLKRLTESGHDVLGASDFTNIHLSGDPSAVVHLITNELVAILGYHVTYGKDFTITAIQCASMPGGYGGFIVHLEIENLKFISLIRTGNCWLVKTPTTNQDKSVTIAGLRSIIRGTVGNDYQAASQPNQQSSVESSVLVNTVKEILVGKPDLLDTANTTGAALAGLARMVAAATINAMPDELKENWWFDRKEDVVESLNQEATAQLLVAFENIILNLAKKAMLDEATAQNEQAKTYTNRAKRLFDLTR